MPTLWNQQEGRGSYAADGSLGVVSPDASWSSREQGAQREDGGPRMDGRHTGSEAAGAETGLRSHA